MKALNTEQTVANKTERTRIVAYIFDIVAKTLLLISDKTKLSYIEINVVAYFVCIPFSWACCLDIFFNFHYLKFIFIVFAIFLKIGFRNFRTLSFWLFDRSVCFLNYFNKFGINYFESSVLLCVFLPIAIYSLLICLLFT